MRPSDYPGYQTSDQQILLDYQETERERGHNRGSGEEQESGAATETASNGLRAKDPRLREQNKRVIIGEHQLEGKQPEQQEVPDRRQQREGEAAV